MANFAPHMGDPQGGPQTSPQHADPYGFLVWFSLKKHQVHVDRRVVGSSVGRHVDHPCGGLISPWRARKAERVDLCPQLSWTKGAMSFLHQNIVDSRLNIGRASSSEHLWSDREARLSFLVLLFLPSLPAASGWRWLEPS